MSDAPSIKPTFDESLAEIEIIVSKRRRDWTYLSILPWEDVSQDIILRIFKKWHLYNPNKAPKLEHWVNTVITHALANLKRDHWGRYSPPCTGGGKANGKSCVFNQGGDSCGYTKSGTKCAECPLYAEWIKKRQHLFHIKSNVTIENHSQEVSNMQDDFSDIGLIKVALDKAMAKELSRWEGKIYKCLFQKHFSPTETRAWLTKEAAKRKRPLSAAEQISYSYVITLQREFKGMMKEWLHREGHIS